MTPYIAGSIIGLVVFFAAMRLCNRADERVAREYREDYL